MRNLNAGWDKWRWGLIGLLMGAALIAFGLTHHIPNNHL
jgi:hypothetical protein